MRKKWNNLSMDKKPERILIISPNWIGDAIMAQPLLQLLKQREPATVIDILAPAWVAPVWEAVPEVSRVYATSFRHGKLQLKERWRMARVLKPCLCFAEYPEIRPDPVDGENSGKNRLSGGKTVWSPECHSPGR